MPIRFGLIDQRFERDGLCLGQSSDHTTIKLNIRSLETRGELTIREAIFPRRSVRPYRPKSSEIAHSLPSLPVSIEKIVHHSAKRESENSVNPTIESLCHGEYHLSR